MEASVVPREAPAGVSGASLFSSPALLRLASDSRLVALIRQGVPAAFEAAYDRHHRPILAFCRHMLGDADEAQDALQHTFLAAYSDLISSEKPIHLRAWLFTIARNRCYSVLRARREHPTCELSDAVTEGLAAQVQRRQDLRDLVRDMGLLPDDQRAALVLAELYALSHQEISEVLEVPRDKVKALVFQARESLLASRTARETDCAEIRHQLATERGGGLRRSNLRRHLRECAGCRDYRKKVERQRRQLALILPVVGSVAVRDAVVGVAVGGAGAGAVGGGLLATSLFKGGLGKLILAGAMALLGTAGTLVASSHLNFLTSSPPHSLSDPSLVALAHGPVTSSLLPSSPALAPDTHSSGPAAGHSSIVVSVRRRNGGGAVSGVKGRAHSRAAPKQFIGIAHDHHAATPRVSAPAAPVISPSPSQGRHYGYGHANGQGAGPSYGNQGGGPGNGNAGSGHPGHAYGNSGGPGQGNGHAYGHQGGQGGGNGQGAGQGGGNGGGQGGGDGGGQGHAYGHNR